MMGRKEQGLTELQALVDAELENIQRIRVQVAGWLGVAEEAQEKRALTQARENLVAASDSLGDCASALQEAINVQPQEAEG